MLSQKRQQETADVAPPRADRSHLPLNKSTSFSGIKDEHAGSAFHSASRSLVLIQSTYYKNTKEVRKRGCHKNGKEQIKKVLP